MFQLPKEIWISLSVMLLIIQSFLLKYPERQEECSVKDKNNYQRASLFSIIYLIMILDLANENRHLIKKI